MNFLCMCLILCVYMPFAWCNTQKFVDTLKGIRALKNIVNDHLRCEDDKGMIEKGTDYLKSNFATPRWRSSYSFSKGPDSYRCTVIKGKLQGIDQDTFINTFGLNMVDTDSKPLLYDVLYDKVAVVFHKDPTGITHFMIMFHVSEIPEYVLQHICLLTATKEKLVLDSVLIYVAKQTTPDNQHTWPSGLSVFTTRVEIPDQKSEGYAIMQTLDSLAKESNSRKTFLIPNAQRIGVSFQKNKQDKSAILVIVTELPINVITQMISDLVLDTRELTTELWDSFLKHIIGLKKLNKVAEELLKSKINTDLNEIATRVATLLPVNNTSDTLDPTLAEKCGFDTELMRGAFGKIPYNFERCKFEGENFIINRLKSCLEDIGSRLASTRSDTLFDKKNFSAGIGFAQHTDSNRITSLKVYIIFQHKRPNDTQ